MFSSFLGNASNGGRLDYESFILYRISQLKISPGDHLRLALRNEEGKESMFQQAYRTMDMFFGSFLFYPAEVRIHPSHLAAIEAQGKRLDVLIDKEIAEFIKEITDLATFPSRVPLVADRELDPFTTVAMYTLTIEEARQAAEMILTAFLKGEGPFRK